MEPSYQCFLVCAFATRLENTQVDAALIALIMDYQQTATCISTELFI